MKGRALRRALQTSDAHRVGGTHELPLIVDTTELITPDVAYEMLLKNKNNRPINWKRVEEYAAIMRDGKWALHAQGIILDGDGNILTGQKRLWAVIYSNVAVHMRVSRGNPASTARLIDRGTPQSARDLASRASGKKHSPLEASIARAMLAMGGNLRPSADAMGDQIAANLPIVAGLLTKTAGTRKTRAVLMVLAAICGFSKGDPGVAGRLVQDLDAMVEALERDLTPHTADECWGRGSAFGMALERARRTVEAHG